MSTSLLSNARIAVIAAMILIAGFATPIHAQIKTPPAPKPTSSATLTPDQKHKAQLSEIFITAAKAKIAQVALEETATARTKDVNPLMLIAGIAAIAEAISQTRASLVQPAPLPAFSKQWAELKSQQTALADLTLRWIDAKTIGATDVLAELPAITKRIDATNAQIIGMIAKDRGVKAADLQRDFDKQIADLRAKLRDILK